MRSFFIIVLLFATSGFCIAQDSLVMQYTPDTKYVEDQFYVGVTYNILANRPSNVSQNSLSYGVQLGFIKDIPVNERRNWALGLGVGYVTASYYNNLKATPINNGVEYSVIDGTTSFSVNKIETHGIEFPLEIRWRTSTAQTFKFWRVYTGFKVGYLFAYQSKYSGDGEDFSFTNDDIERLRYGITLAVGYSTWNFYTYFGLNSLVKNNTATNLNEPINFYPIKVGLQFYIL